MIVLSHGMPKSASTFVFQLLKRILNKSGYNFQDYRGEMSKERSSAFQRISSIDDLEYYNSKIPGDFPFLIKTHSEISPDMQKYIVEQKHLVFATYRDPLDIAISLFDVGESERKRPQEQQRKFFTSILTIDDAIAALPSIVKKAERWLEQDGVVKISYRDINDNVNSVFDTIVSTLNNTDLTADFSLLSKTEILEPFLSNKKDNISTFNVGGVGRWKGKMTDEQVDYVKTKYADFRAKWIEV
jgi:hypothetical protein